MRKTTAFLSSCKYFYAQQTGPSIHADVEMTDSIRSSQSLWIERTTLILTHPLPGISRWFEVEKRELVSEHRWM